jgi:hypothetical protein
MSDTQRQDSITSDILFLLVVIAIVFGLLALFMAAIAWVNWLAKVLL